jgi:hypothetical protein
VVKFESLNHKVSQRIPIAIGTQSHTRGRQLKRDDNNYFKSLSIAGKNFNTGFWISIYTVDSQKDTRTECLL